MDGVLQSPGSPEEDQRNGFKWGGWSAPHWDDTMNEAMGKITSLPYDLLLGRRTFEIFAAFWPHQKDDPTSETFNRINKYVIATTNLDLSWENSFLISGDIVAALKALKSQSGPDLLVYGSGRLVQTLLRHHLIDVLHNWTFPVTLGSGQKLFEEGTQATQWKLLNGTVSSTGVLIASYVPDGDVKRGSF